MLKEPICHVCNEDLNSDYLVRYRYDGSDHVWRCPRCLRVEDPYDRREKLDYEEES